MNYVVLHYVGSGNTSRREALLRNGLELLLEDSLVFGDKQAGSGNELKLLVKLGRSEPKSLAGGASGVVGVGGVGVHLIKL